MRAAMMKLNLSARDYHRTQSVNLVRSEEIQSAHLAEALHAHLHCNTPFGEAVPGNVTVVPS